MRYAQTDNVKPAPSPALPPRGILLLLWVVFFLVQGSVGHDPWKGDDATHFGVIWSLLQGGTSFLPHIAGAPFLDSPPLFHWLGLISAQLFGWLLPAHEAARLATSFCAGLLFICIGFTAQRWHGKASFSPAVLLSLGTLGLLVHAHECQPMMAVAAFTSLGYWGFAWLDRKPISAAILTGLGLAGAVLSGGLVAGLLLAPLWAGPLFIPAWRSTKTLDALLVGLCIALVLVGGYVWALNTLEPAYWDAWLKNELRRLSPRISFARLPDWAKTLSWFTWPALPLAAWAVWRQRRQWHAPALLLPIVFLGLSLATVLLFMEPRSASALPLIAPLALLATSGLPLLRRGATNAFAWFAGVTFSLLSIFLWFAWSTLASGSPARFAATLERLAPGFEFYFSFIGLCIASALSLYWVWLLMTQPRAPERSAALWAAGLITFWGLFANLIQPWVDYGKSYRSVAESLKAALRPLPPGCIIGQGLGASQRASLHYFAGIVTRETADSAQCQRLLAQNGGQDVSTPPGPDWVLNWEGQRPGDRNEILRLYVRH